MKEKRFTKEMAKCAVEQSNGNVIIPKGFTCLASFAFSDCTELQSIVMPDTLKTIGSAAFSGCTNLRKVRMPRGIKVIEAMTFKNCFNLETIEFAQLTRSVIVEDFAFDFCTKLKSLDCRLLSVGNFSFYGCRNLKIDNLVCCKSIGEEAFYSCDLIKEVMIDSCTKLGSNAFPSHTKINKFMLETSSV